MNQVEKYGETPVFFTRKNGEWLAKTWQEFGEETIDFACALAANKISEGSAVNILAGNICEWTVADIGTITAGGVGVGIYPTSSPAQCTFIINHSNAEVLFVDDETQLEKVALIAKELPRLKLIISLSATDFHAEDFAGIRIVSYAEFIETGRKSRSTLAERLLESARNADAEDTAIMVYTSGTTGAPKGAMLSHRYILNSVESLRRSIPIFDDDVTLSYLPACHVAERISGIYNRLYNGTSAYFVEDLSKLYEIMFDVKPTVFASLPRFFEKVYAQVVSRYGNDATAQQLRDAFGGNARLLTSGGAPLANKIADFFAKRELPILQAYGLTENICVAFNTPEAIKFGTVGKPMPMCNVKIGNDGEILVKSEMMFSGYFKEPEKTAEMFDSQGWLLTGDLGALDSDGFLSITGRKKEIIVLSSGKNVAPALLENMVKANHLVSQCFITGDARNYCAALVTLNQAEALEFSQRHSLDAKTGAELVNCAEIYDSINETIESANRRVSRAEQIKKFKILDRDFLPERGEITPTLKIKRDAVAKHFAKDIDNLYEN